MEGISSMNDFMKHKHKMNLFMILLCCALLLTTSSFSGCNKKEATDPADSTPKGRYLEQDLPLPEFDENEIYCNICSDTKGFPVLYSYVLDTSVLSVNTYTYDANGTYRKESPEWLQAIEFDSTHSPLLSLCYTSDGCSYLFVGAYEADSCHGSLYQTKDGNSRTELVMNGWDSAAKSGNPSISPTKVGILDNGLIVVDSYEGLYVYNQEGENIHTIDENYTYSSFITHGNQLICSIQDNGSEEFLGIAVFDGTDFDKEPVTDMFDSFQEYTNAINMNSTNDLIFVNSTGICLKKSGTDLWQTLTDGSLGTMYVPQVIGQYITEDEQNNFYVSYIDYTLGVNSLIKYYYDPNISTVPDTELSIYTLNSDYTLRKAANEFQKLHPDVKVTIDVAMPEESEYITGDGLTKRDYIQSLNTQLLAGNGCDLINVIGLPTSSYIQKGVLADTTDLVDPLCSDGELLNNIMDACRVDGKIYAVPVRFLLPSLFAPAKDCKNLTTISGIADYAKQNPDSFLLGSYILNDFLEAFLPYVTDELITPEDTIDTKVLTDFLTDAKTITDETGLVTNYETIGYNYPSILSAMGGIALSPMNGIANATLKYTYTKCIDYDYAILNNSFTPSLQLGINASSKHKDLAKEFLKLILSEDIQKVDMEDGFPVQSKALEKTRFDIEEGATLTIYTSETTSKEVPIIPITGDLRTQLVDRIKGLNCISANDDAVIEVMTETCGDYFNGKMSLEDTVSQVQNKLSLYSAE